MRGSYFIRPKADEDLNDQAYYYASKEGPELGHRFLVAAHDTFGLLAAHPGIGWRPRFKHLGLESVRIFRISGFEKILVLYRPIPNGVDILRVVRASRDLQALLKREGLK